MHEVNIIGSQYLQSKEFVVRELTAIVAAIVRDLRLAGYVRIRTYGPSYVPPKYILVLAAAISRPNGRPGTDYSRDISN